MTASLVTPIQHTYLALAIVFVVLTLFVTGIRFYSRHISRGSIGIDDWLALVAVCFYLGEVAVHLWSMLAGGVGRHKDQVTAAELVLSFMSLTIVEYPYTAALTCIRISIVLLLKRIFIQKWFRYCAYGLVFLNISWLIFIYFDAAFVCRPFAFNWDQSIVGGHCGIKAESYIIMAVWGIVIDAVTWSLPLIVIWRLQSTKQRKLELSGLFALGLFDIAVSIVRIVQLENLDFSGDFSYTLAPVEIWSFVEAGVAIIIGNAPSCRQAVQQFLGFSRSTVTSRRGNYVFSANQGTKRSGGSKTLRGDDDEDVLWPAGVMSSAYAPADNKHPMGDLTPSATSTSQTDEEDTKSPREVAVHTEVWLSQGWSAG